MDGPRPVKKQENATAPTLGPNRPVAFYRKWDRALPQLAAQRCTAKPTQARFPSHPLPGRGRTRQLGTGTGPGDGCCQGFAGGVPGSPTGPFPQFVPSKFQFAAGRTATWGTRLGDPVPAILANSRADGGPHNRSGPQSLGIKWNPLKEIP